MSVGVFYADQWNTSNPHLGNANLHHYNEK